MTPPKDYVSKIIKLNNEYRDASSKRRLEIEQEIINSTPNDLVPSSKIKELSELQSTLKSKLTSLTKVENIKELIVELEQMNEEILTHAKKIGIDLEATTYARELKKLIDEKF